MSNKDYSKQEIAKQFDLPERKSKIATLLKETDVYCLCRSSDSTRFMIACDSCEEWYHGDCINITESESRHIKQYFCPPCMERNPSLEIEYKKAKPSSSSQKHKAKSGTSSSDKKYDSKKTGSSNKSSSKKFSSDVPTHSSKGDSSSFRDSNRCGSCPGCLAVVDCFKCDVCTRSKYLDKKRRVCKKRECMHKDDSGSDYYEEKKLSPQVLSERQLDITDEEDNWVPSPQKAKKQKLTPSSKRGSKKQQKGLKDKSKEKSRRKSRVAQRETSSSSSEEHVSDYSSEEEKQCFGLDCTNAARKNSKYCSQECCIKLATERLYRILPGRIQEWNLTPSAAEERNRKELEEIRKKQVDTKNRISELERKRSDLDRHVQIVQQLIVDPDAEDDEPEEEGIIHCITCGHEIAAKTCLKHMERCYNKYESQTSFGSIYKTKLEGTPIFCDFYNPGNGTYCKRLAVLCPEHSKEPKILDSEVCGCPVVTKFDNSASDKSILSDKFCRLPKKKCNKHFCWEKLRRAEVDMERVRSWLKLDELFEQERQIRQAMANRGGVMGLLLHSTFDHDLRNRIQTQMQEDKESSGTPDLGEEDISEEEDDFTREPLVKSREHEKDHRQSAEVIEKPEITASKLYKKMMNNK